MICFDKLSMTLFRVALSLSKGLFSRGVTLMFTRKTTVLALLVLLWTNPVHAEPRGQWKELPPTPSKRTEVAAAILDGKVYVVGGFSNKGIADQVEVWNPETGEWSRTQPLPRPLHHTTASAVNGKLYVIGGFSTGMWAPVNTTYEYDPGKHEWTEKARMPTKRGALAAAVIDGKIYVVGGAHRKIFSLVNTAALEVYDPASDSWKKLAPVPTPRDHLAASSLDGKLYAIGGRVDVDYHHNLDTNETYDPKTNQWTSLKPLPTKRSGITSQVLDGKILVLGGESGERTFTENEAYDPKTDSWETLAPMPTGRHGLGSAAYKGTVHLFDGGPNPGGGGSNTHTRFKLESK